MMSQPGELSFLKQSPALMALLDEALRCLRLSRGWRRHIGVSDDESVEGWPVSRFLESDGATNLEAELSEVIDKGRIVECLPLVVCLDDASTRARLTAWPVEIPGRASPCIALLVEDIEELRKAVAELRELEVHHQLILDAAGEGIYGLDRDGRLTFGNDASRQILGWKPDEIAGQLAHAVHHHSHEDGSPYAREDCPIYAALKDGEVHRVDDEVFWHTDGSPIPVEYTSTPILKDGKPDGAVVVFRDITERRRAEREQEETYEQIRHLKEQLEQERDYLREEINVTVNFGEIVGESTALKRTLAQIEAVADTPVSVLVLGESGVGKEMIARAIHTKSSRAEKPLVKVNCASVPKELFESEFFGHVRGAFTGAHQDRVGRLQLADGGTLFLDEVGEIPLSQQGKLLRALQEHEFERVGDDATRKVDVRFVAATNRDLADEVAAGRFREDLYYRLSVFPVEVPPLRERTEDIAPLATHFLEQICRELGRDVPKVSHRQLEPLRRHDWPGNIRELKNVIERAVVLTRGERLRLDLALGTVTRTEPSVDAQPTESPDYLTEAEFREKERSNLIAALVHAGGKVWGPRGAAALMDIKPSTFRYRMTVLGVDKADYADRRVP